MNEFLDSWTTTRKLPNEYRRSRKYAAIGKPGFKSARDLYDEPATSPAPAPAPPLPIEETKYILEHGKQAWREKYRPTESEPLRRNGALTYTPEGWPIVPYCGKSKSRCMVMGKETSGNERNKELFDTKIYQGKSP